MTSRDFGFLTLRNTIAYQPDGNPVPPNSVFVTSTNGSAVFSDNVTIDTLNASTLNIGFQRYNSTNISSNFGKNILLRSSTISTVPLSTTIAPNGTFINFINWSGINYNIITTGPNDNYLNTNTLLSCFYTSIDSLGWIAPSYYVAPPPPDTSSMKINIYVSSLTSYSTMSLPFGGITGIHVNWGDGILTPATSTPPTHNYQHIGNYTITIGGSASSFGDANVYTGATLISSVSQWGTLGFSSLDGAFIGATNLVSVPNNIPSSVINMSNMFDGASSFNQDLSNWSTSNIKYMSSMFRGTSSFNQNLSMWNVSSVISADNIFCGCPKMLANGHYWPHINPPPTSWGCNTDNIMIINISVTSLTTFSTMSLPFGGITGIHVNWGDAFVSSYTSMPIPVHTYSATGYYPITIGGSASSFGGNLFGYIGVSLISSVSQWGTLGLTSLACAFAGAANLVSVPPNILSSVTDMSYMFGMSNIFSPSSLFNDHNILSWDTSHVISMDGMFSGTSSFNQPLNNWNTSSVTNMNLMFLQATAFNQSLNNWSTSNVSTMTRMFNGATVFNSSINNWNVSSVTDMSYMFDGASSFNQPLNNWNTSSVLNMTYMFHGASSFNQDISTWNVSNILTANYIFCNCPLMLANAANRPNITISYISSCS